MKDKKEAKEKTPKIESAFKPKEKAISYRMKCPKTANGLSHFVMYGDIKEEETLL